MIMGYLIRDWTDVPKRKSGEQVSDETEVYDKFVYPGDIWVEIDKAKKAGKQICVFEIEKCILDWS